MICESSEAGYKQPAEGINLKVLVHGKNMLMAKFKLTAGSVLPEHQHPHEQTGYLISGRIRFHAQGQEPFETGPGGSWYVEPDVPHWAETLEDAEVIEVFHPIREDFLAM